MVERKTFQSGISIAVFLRCIIRFSFVRYIFDNVKCSVVIFILLKHLRYLRRAVFSDFSLIGYLHITFLSFLCCNPFFYVVSYVTFILSLFVPRLVFVWCLWTQDIFNYIFLLAVPRRYFCCCSSLSIRYMFGRSVSIKCYLLFSLYTIKHLYGALLGLWSVVVTSSWNIHSQLLEIEELVVILCISCRYDCCAWFSGGGHGKLGTYHIQGVRNAIWEWSKFCQKSWRHQYSDRTWSCAHGMQLFRNVF